MGAEGHVSQGTLSEALSEYALPEKPPGTDQLLSDPLAHLRLASEVKVPEETAWTELSR